ncbi:outer membrane beta-barrel family protein, partial [Xanthovirga aplysinae]|uniref:outer membrane beta-barrel family protein n=1 Tax=Xanthovirga aplysinae TaxID=2529853 RepID=UPI0012BBE45B
STFSNTGTRTKSENLEETNQINEVKNDLFSILTETEFEHKLNSKKDLVKIEVEYEFEAKEKSEMFLESSSTKNNFNSDSFDRLLSNKLKLRSRYDKALKNDGYLTIGYQFDLNTIDQNQAFSDNLNFTSAVNNIMFTQFDNTAFADYFNEFGSISYNIGLRLVNTERKLNNEDTNESSGKNFLNLLPQIGLEYEYGEGNEISLNYFSLLRQPRLTFLNNFNSSLDLQRISVGNPDLKPQSTQYIELEFLNEFENSSLSTTLYTNFVKDIIQYSSVFDSENDITITRPENIGRATTFGIDFSYSLNFPKWLKTIVKLNGRYGAISKEDIDNNGFYSVKSSIINIIRLKSYKLECSWFFNPKSKVNFQTFQKSNQYFKFGVSRRVFKNKGNLVLSVLDPFNSARIIQNIEG